jgi:hypothetical protein
MKTLSGIFKFTKPYKSVNGVCDFRTGEKIVMMKSTDMDVDIVVKGRGYTLPRSDFEAHSEQVEGTYGQSR